MKLSKLLIILLYKIIWPVLLGRKSHKNYCIIFFLYSLTLISYRIFLTRFYFTFSLPSVFSIVLFFQILFFSPSLHFLTFSFWKQVKKYYNQTYIVLSWDSNRRSTGSYPPIWPLGYRSWSFLLICYVTFYLHFLFTFSFNFLFHLLASLFLYFINPLSTLHAHFTFAQQFFSDFIFSLHFTLHFIFTFSTFSFFFSSVYILTLFYLLISESTLGLFFVSTFLFRFLS